MTTFDRTRHEHASNNNDRQTSPTVAANTTPAAAPRPASTAVAFSTDAYATAALTLFTIAVAAGYARAFSGWAFLASLTIVVIALHTVAFVFRRARVPVYLAIPLELLIGAWIILLQNYPATLTPLPTATTFDAVERDLRLVIEQFPTAVAPVNFDVGWALIAAIGVMLAAVFGDAFAFRAYGRGEALIPGGALFVFVAAVGSPRQRVELTMLLVAAGVIAIIALRAAFDQTPRLRHSNRWSLIPLSAVAAATLIAVGASWVGPRLPGAGEQPVIETKGGGGVRTEIVSPLVDIRSRLTNQSNLELFRVNATQPAYWRVTTLPAFDGTQFRLPARELSNIDQSLSDSVADDLETGRRVEIRQQIQIIAAGGRTVPAAPDPYQASGTMASGDDLELRINRDTSTLLAPDELNDGDLLTVVSALPSLDASVLEGRTTTPPDDIYVELPDDLPPVVAETAAAVTAGAQTRYQQAIALQNFFRTQFDYSLEVQAGHGSSAIESFLSARVGYCEQFAATYAAMGRTLGIPTRVAVGYTTGTQREDGWYSVRGKQAHSWPEIYFDEVGWVAFEPTPGRGAPGAEQYTGINPQQDTSGPTDVPDEIAVPNTTPNPATPATLPGSGNIGDPDASANNAAASNPEPAVADAPGGVRWWPVSIGLGVVALLSAPWLRRWWQRRREDALPGPQRAGVALQRAQRAATSAGVPAGPSSTASEWVAATRVHLPAAEQPLRDLAAVHERLLFAPESAAAPDAADVGQWADQVERCVADNQSVSDKIGQYFSVR